jgi:hypothetical protein
VGCLVSCGCQCERRVNVSDCTILSYYLCVIVVCQVATIPSVHTHLFDPWHYFCLKQATWLDVQFGMSGTVTHRNSMVHESISCCNICHNSIHYSAIDIIRTFAPAFARIDTNLLTKLIYWRHCSIVECYGHGGYNMARHWVALWLEYYDGAHIRS